MIKLTEIETPLGTMVAGATEQGVCLLEFSDRKKLPKEYNDLQRLIGRDIEPGNNKHLELLKKQLTEYFNGKRKEFSLLLITPGTDFQNQVWHELLKIPYGTTRSYQSQADSLSRPTAVRAVANANGDNRIAILIPCHRVIGTDGRLTGYGGGLWRKKWLLDHEKEQSGKAVDLSLF